MHETLSKIAIGLYKKPFLLLCLMHLIVAFLIVTLFLTRNVFAQQIFHVDGAIAGNSFSFPLLALLILLLPLSFLSVSVKVKNSLKDSQDFIRKITDTIPNILYVYDIAKSRNILVNSQVFDILGYTVDEIQDLGAAFLQTLMHPDDFARLHEHFAKFDDLQDGEYCEFEYRMRHKNGDWRWLSSRETIFKRDENGKIEQILGTAQDITERKSIQDLLEESEKFNRSIIESSDDCIKILDLEGNLLYLNPRGMELLEIEDSASCIGSIWTEFWEGAARKLSQIAVEEAKAGGIGKFQSPCKTQRGTNKWWDVSVTPITDLQGKIRQLLVISRDITQYKLADEELRRSENDTATSSKRKPN